MSDYDMDFAASLSDNPLLSETLELAGEPTVDNLKRILLQARKRYLSAKLRARDLGSEHIEEELAKLADIAFLLESLSVDGLSAGNTGQLTEIRRALELAGLIFEYVGDFAPEYHSYVRPHNWYLHSAICYSLGQYEANSIVLIRRILEKAKQRLKISSEESTSDHFISLIHYSVLALLARSVYEAGMCQ